MSDYAPIALFAYDRLKHLQQTVEALLKNPESLESDLFVFSDAAKDSAHVSAVEEVRKYAGEITGFSTVHVIERVKNYGLASSIIDGVTSICREYKRVIVLEDDVVTSSCFLKYMNDGLDMYSHNEQVISIHGYIYPTDERLPETFFLRGADCWGWATWQRGWDIFEHDGRLLLQQLRQRNLTQRFDYNGAYPYARMLEDQIVGKNDSWAIRWHASAFLQNRLTLYPGRSLVMNIGNDNSGTHCTASIDFSGELADEPVKVERIPLEENEIARQAFINFFRSQRPSILTKVFRRVARIMGRAN